MKRSLLAGLSLALGGLAAPAAAQTPDLAFAVQQLDRAVVSLASSSASFTEDMSVVARLHEKVLRLRMPNDPGRFECLLDQASFLLATGDLKGARRFAGAAVSQAEASGDIANAADASVTAAILAQQAGDRDAARVWRLNARTLATLPEVRPAQAAAIASRLYGERWRATVPGQRVMVDE
jgi:hypothetical protein